MKTLIGFLRNDEGATAVEYGLLAGILSVAIIVGVGALSGNLQAVFELINDKIKPSP